jgi:hypothetical protein
MKELVREFVCRFLERERERVRQRQKKRIKKRRARLPLVFIFCSKAPSFYSSASRVQDSVI